MFIQKSLALYSNLKFSNIHTKLQGQYNMLTDGHVHRMFEITTECNTKLHVVAHFFFWTGKSVFEMKSFGFVKLIMSHLEI
jgi:uncharacterized membrane protein